MLGTVLTRLQQQVTSLISNVMTLTQLWLSKIIGVLTAMQTLFVASLTNLSSLFVQTVQKCKALVAKFTTLASSIKVALTIVKQLVIQIGLLLQTTVQQTRQLVMSLLKKDK